MREKKLWLGAIFFLTWILSGCVVRTYPLTRDRVDQDLDIGNRGYLEGSKPYAEGAERKSTRTTQVIEVELNPPIRFEKKPKIKSPAVAESVRPLQVRRSAITLPEKDEDLLEGNRGYITQRITPEIVESETKLVQIFQHYTVKKNDTLQKISKEFYGTTKKWRGIYEANKDILRGPDKIYPGQVIKIPTETLKETKENLK